ncbi:undecaprenyl-diphosphate phosphatase [Paenibacillus silviterrae]|uniref:undecaprenyl-diphosphate phosphatase n=1 Tax=Paenibacillus silviterrae TaxID=3242194 RepID=UPI0025433191|nr:undecaprenyl-diphosphate phosphatase [Paenibacillus chinjuensis]
METNHAIIRPYKSDKPGPRLNLFHIAIAIVPALGLAYVLKDFIKGQLFSPTTVLIGLVLGGILLIIGEKQQGTVTTRMWIRLLISRLSWSAYGRFLSIWPGFSRSGSTIAGGMLSA